MNIQYEYTISLYIYIFLTIVNKKIIIYNNKDIFWNVKYRLRQKEW